MYKLAFLLNILVQDSAVLSSLHYKVTKVTLKFTYHNGRSISPLLEDWEALDLVLGTMVMGRLTPFGLKCCVLHLFIFMPLGP